MEWAFYSSRTENTKRFMDRLAPTAKRIPISRRAQMPEMTDRFILVCPTYAGADGRNAVPGQVIRFLNDPLNREKLVGVVGAGNRNFGKTFGLGARLISSKCQVPLLHVFELAGTERDIASISDRLNVFGEHHA